MDCQWTKYQAHTIETIINEKSKDILMIIRKLNLTIWIIMIKIK